MSGKGLLNIGVKKRQSVCNNRDLENQRHDQRQSQQQQQQNQGVGGNYNGVYYDRFGRAMRHTENYNGYDQQTRSHGHDYNDGYHPHGWDFNAKNLCWGLFWLIGFAIAILGVIGFIVALSNSGRITTLETSVTSLIMTDQALQSSLDKLIVPFDHTSAGPLQVGTETQYINIAAVAAMTLPGDLSSYLNNKICVISKTAFAHTITMAAGATWDGANTIATFGGAVGDGICFHVFSSTQVQVQHVTNIGFS